MFKMERRKRLLQMMYYWIRQNLKVIAENYSAKSAKKDSEY
jgi:hypothetical protein